MTLSVTAAKQCHIDDIPLQEISSASPCIGHCTTVLGDDVCRGCLRTFDEAMLWLSRLEQATKPDTATTAHG